MAGKREICSFKLDHYKYTLKKASGMGYNLCSFKDFKQSMKKVVILRHDIDYALDSLLDFALIEKEIGATATYLLRVHAKEYNPFSFRTYKMIKEVIKLGHEIGLHFECAMFDALGWADAKTIFIKEKEILESIYDVTVETASQHRGVANFSEKDYMFFDRHAVRDVGIKRYVFSGPFKSMRYISDSNSVWREGCLCQNLDKFNRIHVLIHPIWWFKDHYCLKPEAPLV